MILTLVLWAGMIGAIREWWYAKRAGRPIPGTEKWYLGGGLVLALVAALVSDTVGTSDYLNALMGTKATSPLWVALVLIAWTVRQMVRRSHATAEKR